MLAAVFLLTLLFTPLQVFAATMQNQDHQKAILPLSWSCGNPTTGHCYGTQFWGGANGADTRISLATSLSGGGTINDQANESFVTTELWLDSSNYTYWVEVGVISADERFGTTYPIYFWADNRPNGGGFSFHYFNAIPGNEESPLFRINRIDSSDWNVLVRDSLTSYTGTSTANNFSVKYIEIGTELHNNYQTAYEPYILYSYNRWLDSHGNFHYQTNDGLFVNINYPVDAGWYNGQDPTSNNTGGVWYSCIPGYGC